MYGRPMRDYQEIGEGRGDKRDLDEPWSISSEWSPYSFDQTLPRKNVDLEVAAETCGLLFVCPDGYDATSPKAPSSTICYLSSPPTPNRGAAQ